MGSSSPTPEEKEKIVNWLSSGSSDARVKFLQTLVNNMLRPLELPPDPRKRLRRNRNYVSFENQRLSNRCKIKRKYDRLTQQNRNKKQSHNRNPKRFKVHKLANVLQSNEEINPATTALSQIPPTFVYVNENLMKIKLESDYAPIKDEPKSIEMNVNAQIIDETETRLTGEQSGKVSEGENEPSEIPQSVPVLQQPDSVSELGSQNEVHSVPEVEQQMEDEETGGGHDVFYAEQKLAQELDWDVNAILDIAFDSKSNDIQPKNATAEISPNSDAETNIGSELDIPHDVQVQSTSYPVPATSTVLTTSPIPGFSPAPAPPYIPVTSPVSEAPYFPITSPVSAAPYFPITSPVSAAPYFPITSPVSEIPYLPITSPVSEIPYLPITSPVSETPYLPITSPVSVTPSVPGASLAQATLSVSPTPSVPEASFLQATIAAPTTSAIPTTSSFAAYSSVQATSYVPATSSFPARFAAPTTSMAPPASLRAAYPLVQSTLPIPAKSCFPATSPLLSASPVSVAFRSIPMGSTVQARSWSSHQQVSRVQSTSMNLTASSIPATSNVKYIPISDQFRPTSSNLVATKNFRRNPPVPHRPLPSACRKRQRLPLRQPPAFHQLPLIELPPPFYQPEALYQMPTIQQPPSFHHHPAVIQSPTMHRPFVLHQSPGFPQPPVIHQDPVMPQLPAILQDQALRQPPAIHPDQAFHQDPNLRAPSALHQHQDYPPAFLNFAKSFPTIAKDVVKFHSLKSLSHNHRC